MYKFLEMHCIISLPQNGVVVDIAQDIGICRIEHNKIKLAY